mmetsp:Transcript_2674/g.9472  ORF Transcript_2674/g.9472 Transcript_2674/m.9472 type:complete len:248 (+) Transcript_2674:1680-2423(+)
MCRRHSRRRPTSSLDLTRRWLRSRSQRRLPTPPRCLASASWPCRHLQSTKACIALSSPSPPSLALRLHERWRQRAAGGKGACSSLIQPARAWHGHISVNPPYHRYKPSSSSSVHKSSSHPLRWTAPAAPAGRPTRRSAARLSEALRSPVVSMGLAVGKAVGPLPLPNPSPAPRTAAAVPAALPRAAGAAAVWAYAVARAAGATALAAAAAAGRKEAPLAAMRRAPIRAKPPATLAAISSPASPKPYS